jgi:hypothetical protein
LKGKCPAKESFQRGESLLVLQIDLFRGGDETHVSLEEILHCSMQEHLAHSFPERIELVLREKLPATLVFQGADRCRWLQLGIFH